MVVWRPRGVGEQIMSSALRVGRTVLFVVLLAAAGVVAPASAVYADRPSRTVVVPENVVFPAGQGCSFPVAEEVDEGASVTVTEFADGRRFTQGRAYPTLTNLETGDSLVHHTTVNTTEYPSVAGETVVTISGQLFMSIWPGDQGPYGLVEYPGLLLSVNGHVRLTADSSTGVYTSFTLNGTATDLCAALAPE
jgi:hypothetical protein